MRPGTHQRALLSLDDKHLTAYGKPPAKRGKQALPA
jgi:hypothetical protein